MASAQVLQNSAASSSRKLGHLEAGKRRLEEFRKKKAEGKSKKTASSGPTEVDLKPKESVGDETLTISSDETLKKDNSGLPKHEESSSNSASSSSKSEIKNTFTSHEDSSPSGISDLKSQNIDVDFDRWRPLQSSSVDKKPSDSSSPSTNFDIKSRFISHEDSSHGTSDLKGQRPSVDFDQWRPSQSSLLDIKPSDPASPSAQFDIKKSSHGGTSDLKSQRTGVDLDRGHPSQSSPANIKPSDSASPSRKFYVKSRFISDEDSSRGGMSDLKSQLIGVDFDRLRHLQDSSVDSGSILRNSSAQLPSTSSASSPATSWRTRPSFHDFLNRPKPSSSLSTATTTTNSLFAESAKAASMHFEGTRDPISASSDSKSDGNQGKDVMDGLGKRLPDLPTSVKDEDFAALEQHIEDLTQEKFSLQRALESSRALAESLASENSSLTENYNQQRKIVNELKSEMEHLQEEFRSHLREVEAAKMESASAQLECSAADERAKILASEVIGLEEKALRLRSNELKLEKQLESFNAEIGSYKRKISSLEKERQDFQSTIEAMQEEKKLLLDKVRKTSTNDRADTQKAFVSKKDSFTSTEDLVAETSNSNDDSNLRESASSPETDSLSRNVSASVLQSESGLHFIQDVSVMIPHDQKRMIDNISSLISELTLEKEELIRVLRTKSSDFSKLMDTNKDLSQKLERQTQRLEFLTAQKMASESVSMRPVQALSIQETTGYTDEGDEVVERVLGWIMKMFPGGPSKRRTSKLL